MKGSLACLVVVSLIFGLVRAQPFRPGQPGVVPLGNLRTNDGGGPYDLSLLPIQVSEVRGAMAFRQNYTDQDIIDFLSQVECLEGLFDTYGTFGVGFNGDLAKGGPTPKGARQANLTDKTLPFLQEVALNEQGHALFVRHAGSSLPCPAIDFDEGFNALMAVAYNLTQCYQPNSVDLIKQTFGAPFDPFKNDQNFVLSVLALEEVGARGNKGLTGLLSNPVLAGGVAGLATSASSQATSERHVLWQLRNAIVEPFGETAQQVFARISAARDMLDGPPVDDQGLVQTDPRSIAVPFELVNMVPTDLTGLTFAMTPAQAIRIVTVAAPLVNGKAIGGFFPNGLNGKIVSWEGYDQLASGLDDFPTGVATAADPACVFISAPEPSSPLLPPNVTDELALTQGLDGPADDGTYMTRGFTTPANQQPFISSEPQVNVSQNQCPRRKFGRARSLLARLWSLLN